MAHPRSAYAFALLLAAACAPVALLVEAPEKELRDPENRPEAEAVGARVLLLGVDGLRADIFEEELEAGNLPGFAELLGGVDDQGELAHAYVHHKAIAPYPSVTAVGWSTVVTGKPPAEHGVTGNEMLLRPSGRFVAPVPMSVDDRSDVLATYNEQLFAKLLKTPTVWTRLHERGLTSWVATNHVHVGADRLLLPGREDLIQGVAQTMMGHMGLTDGDEAAYSELDDGTFSTVLDALEADEEPPDVLMVYASGTDLLAHHENAPGLDAQRRYLREQLNRRAGQLAAYLRHHGNWYVILTADHGHTDVLPDDAHALAVGGEDAPGHRVLREAGFKPHAPSLGTLEGSDDAVFAHQSGAAFVYLADRSKCDEDRCSWSFPPRYEEEVLVAADAFHEARSEGGPMEQSLAMVLVRQPVPFEEEDHAFEVYLGAGKTMDVGTYLANHPEHSGPAMAERLHRLAVGRYGERAGDVMLIARTDPDHVEKRYYFGQQYEATHGSALPTDSMVPFVLSHPELTRAQLGSLVKNMAGEVLYLDEVAPIIEKLATSPRLAVDAR